MSSPSSPRQATSAYPSIIPPTQPMAVSTSPPLTSASSTHSSSSESDSHLSSSSRSISRRMRMERPRMGDRQRSSSIIIPKGVDTYQREKPNYGPGDARAMSPRRSSQDLAALGGSARQSLKDQARTLQSSLAALAERIDEVRLDHDKLESENKFLQDYIGGLTRNMSRDGIGQSASTAKKTRK